MKSHQSSILGALRYLGLVSKESADMVLSLSDCVFYPCVRTEPVQATAIARMGRTIDTFVFERTEPTASTQTYSAKAFPRWFRPMYFTSWNGRCQYGNLVFFFFLSSVYNPHSQSGCWIDEAKTMFSISMSSFSGNRGGVKGGGRELHRYHYAGCFCLYIICIGCQATERRNGKDGQPSDNPRLSDRQMDAKGYSEGGGRIEVQDKGAQQARKGKARKERVLDGLCSEHAGP